ncbi:hypothetical protein H920_15503 [Fukomys damarensis]|uniref:Protein BNIP5 n=1 Tax=Fukomys damarensis TaxID=885580 RepID=A0A091CZ52_FUKDA|nr:hypothetical protein H920_15503 [Fukomys damarensis]
MEKPGDPRRAQSLDRSHTPRKDSESTGCQCLSLPGTPCRKAPRRAISDGAGCAQSPSPSSGAQGTGAAAAHTLEEMRGFVLSEQRHPPDTKKDKAQRQAQQGWLKTMLNFFLRTGFEEPKDKASRRPKGKEEPPQPPEAAEELVLRKKAQDKKTGHKKCGHRKHGAEEAKGNHHRDAGGHRARLPKMAAASHSEEAEGGPVCRDTHTPPPCVPGGLDPSSAGARAGLSNVSPQAQATGPRPEEEPRTPDQEAVIQMTVELLKKVGDQWEDELQAPQPEALLQNPAPACRRKSQEKMPGRVKRAFSLKKCGPEEPRRARAAHVPSPEARPPKRPSFLPLCIRGPWLSTSSSPGSEGPGAHEALSADGDGPRPLELPTCTRCQGPEEGLLLDRASEPNDFMQKILALLQGAEEPEGQQTLVQETEAAGESLALACKKKSQEKKPSSLRRAFSHKRHSSKEPRRAETVGAATPEPRPSKRSSFLPLCVGGPEELVICKLVALLQEEDGELGRQIQRHPSLKRCFEEFSDSSLWRLVATLRSRKAGPLDGDGSLLPKRIFPFALGVGSKYAEGHSRTICSLMGSRGHYGQHGGAQCPSKEAQPDLTSPECQSPD